MAYWGFRTKNNLIAWSIFFAATSVAVALLAIGWFLALDKPNRGCYADMQECLEACDHEVPADYRGDFSVPDVCVFNDKAHYSTFECCRACKVEQDECWSWGVLLLSCGCGCGFVSLLACCFFACCSVHPGRRHLHLYMDAPPLALRILNGKRVQRETAGTNTGKMALSQPLEFLPEVDNNELRNLNEQNDSYARKLAAKLAVLKAPWRSFTLPNQLKAPVKAVGEQIGHGGRLMLHVTSKVWRGRIFGASAGGSPENTGKASMHDQRVAQSARELSAHERAKVLDKYRASSSPTTAIAPHLATAQGSRVHEAAKRADTRAIYSESNISNNSLEWAKIAREDGDAEPGTSDPPARPLSPEEADEMMSEMMSDGDPTSPDSTVSNGASASMQVAPPAHTRTLARQHYSCNDNPMRSFVPMMTIREAQRVSSTTPSAASAVPSGKESMTPSRADGPTSSAMTSMQHRGGWSSNSMQYRSSGSANPWPPPPAPQQSQDALGAAPQIARGDTGHSNYSVESDAMSAMSTFAGVPMGPLPVVQVPERAHRPAARNADDDPPDPELAELQ